MSERCWTVRGYITRDGEVLLKAAPAHAAGGWLSEVLAAHADQEVLITVTYQGVGRPHWAPTAVRRLEQPRVVVEPARLLGSGR